MHSVHKRRSGLTPLLRQSHVHDRDGLVPPLKAVSQKSPWVKLAFVHGGYAGDETQRAAYEAAGP
jgi:hypothetical protein